ncbi:MAG: hypothetical protein methR_P0225 [Methyloprofundus sp.]|nr:MAG: hypothetical protein methR_P0225 [Methyloprofundus sp.]
MHNLIKKLTVITLLISLLGCSSHRARETATATLQVADGQEIQVGRFSNEMGFTDPNKIKSNLSYLEPIVTIVKDTLKEELIAAGYQVKKSDIAISGKIHRIWGQNKITFIIKDTLTNEVLLEKLFRSKISSGLLRDKLSHKSNLHVLMQHFLQDPDVLDIIEKYNTPEPIAPPPNTPNTRTLVAPIINDDFQDKKRVALVIGNSNYKVGYLKNPQNDATDIAKVLRDLGFVVILEIDADQKKMDTALLSFGRELANGGVGLFYYAGHGVQVNGSNFLIPVGANIEEERDVKYKALNLAQVLDEMRDAQTGLNIVLLDACRDNPLAKSSRSSTRGLARVTSPSGSIIIYSTSPGSVAADGTGRNGLFSKHLLQHITTQDQTIESVMKQVSKNVQEESKNKQTPWMESSFTGNFYFSRQKNSIKQKNTIAADPAPAKPPEDNAQLTEDTQPKDIILPKKNTPKESSDNLDINQD